jgi:hypothetical protein
MAFGFGFSFWPCPRWPFSPLAARTFCPGQKLETSWKEGRGGSYGQGTQAAKRHHPCQRGLSGKLSRRPFFWESRGKKLGKGEAFGYGHGHKRGGTMDGTRPS